jgi:hypothetical protein
MTSQRRVPNGEACGSDDLGVPKCGTGPTGRLRFVARELAALWRDRRHRGAAQSSLPDPTGW